MSVTKEVRDFISNSFADNNRALLTQISKLVSDSAENLKRANAEAVDEQLRQVKKLRREEPKSFKRKGNEIQYKFISKLQDSLEEAKTHLETNAVEKAKESLTEGTLLLTNRQKLILLADKSEFGWKTVEEYSQHELAEDDDGKKIRRAEERAEEALKSASTRKTAKQVSSVFRPSSSRKYLVFSWDFSTGVDRYFQCTVLPLGLSSAPFIFTKLLKLWKPSGGDKEFQSLYFLMTA